MPYRNAVHMHFINQLENLENYVERPRYHIRDDAFELLSEREFVSLYRLKKQTAQSVINIVEQNMGPTPRSSALDATVQVSL